MNRPQPHALAVLPLLLVACGVSQEASTPGDTTPGGPNGTVISDDAGPATPSADSGVVDRNAACAQSVAAAKPGLSYLVVEFDRSGSMGDATDPASRIAMGKTALATFFNSPSSKGLNASLSVFPHQGTGSIGNEVITESQDDEVLCGADSYDDAVSSGQMQALPSAALSGAVGSIQAFGGTPTLPALKGAKAYAQTVAAAHPGAKVAIVLVTDGIPIDCYSGSETDEVNNIATYVGSIKNETPTYVIGIGDNLTALNQVAQAGSGQNAIFVSDSANASADLLAALDKVKAQTISCDLALPQVPAGMSMDFAKLNVLYTPSGGSESALSYNPGCAGGTGWQYDNVGAPTKLELCAGSCKSIQGDATAKVDLLVGCATAKSEIK